MRRNLNMEQSEKHAKRKPKIKNLYEFSFSTGAFRKSPTSINWSSVDEYCKITKSF